MKNIFVKLFTAIILCFSIFLFSSCGKKTFLEKGSGNWKVASVEIAYYKNFAATPDSVITFSTGDLGIFNFGASQDASFGGVSVNISYPSQFLHDGWSSTYTLNQHNSEILVIVQTFAQNTYNTEITVSGNKKNKQEWLIMSDDFVGNVVTETISVEKI